LKFFSGKRGLAISYASLFAFFLFFSIPIGSVYLTLKNAEIFSKLNQIISNKPANTANASGQFSIAFLFIFLMVVLTGFMYLLTAKSREFAFRFFTIIFGCYTIVAFGYKVIVTAALTNAVSKLDSGILKDQAPAVVKTFTSNFIIFGVIGALLSILSLIVGLIGRSAKEL
jgi:hypothetical protein